MNQCLVDSAPPGSLGTCTPTGWITEEVHDFLKTLPATSDPFDL